MRVAKSIAYNVLFIVVFLSITVIANAEVLDFENLYTGDETFNTLPVGYSGFNWSSDAYYMTDQFIPGSGYEFGTIGKVSLFTLDQDYISVSGGVFDFNGSYITAAWNTGQDVTVQGWRNDSLIYSNTVTTSYILNGNDNWFDFNYNSVDKVSFIPGTLGENANLGGTGNNIILDNITVAVAPEPISSTLFLVGGATLGFRRFRKKFMK